MSGPPHIALVVWACLSVALAPVLGGTVACMTDGGHRAIERAHLTGGCPAAREEAGHHEEGGEPSPCRDVRLANDDLTRPERPAGYSATAGLHLIPWFAMVTPSVPDLGGLYRGLASPDRSPPVIPGDLKRLDHIVLLI